MHDLQPYICTYQDCSQPHQLYRSRRQWVAHESSEHRRLYRCYEHSDLLYHSPDELKAHLQRDHVGLLTDAQIDSLVGLSDVSLLDERPHCPICFEPAPFLRGLESHLAHHLERLAMFALPISVVADADSKADKPDSQKIRERSFDSGQSLDPPEFSNHGPNNASSDNRVGARSPQKREFSDDGPNKASSDNNVGSGSRQKKKWHSRGEIRKVHVWWVWFCVSPTPVCSPTPSPRHPNWESQCKCGHGPYNEDIDVRCHVFTCTHSHCSYCKDEKRTEPEYQE